MDNREIELLNQQRNTMQKLGIDYKSCFVCLSIELDSYKSYFLKHGSTIRIFKELVVNLIIYKNFRDSEGKN